MQAHRDSAAGNGDKAITPQEIHSDPASERLISVTHLGAGGETKTSWITESRLTDFLRRTLAS